VGYRSPIQQSEDSIFSAQRSAQHQSDHRIKSLMRTSQISQSASDSPEAIEVVEFRGRLATEATSYTETREQLVRDNSHFEIAKIAIAPLENSGIQDFRH
jgi:hypothetical protein